VRRGWGGATQAGGMRAVGSPTLRWRAAGQRGYWRSTVAELHAGASAGRLPFFGPFAPEFSFTLSAGPQGVGERWLADQVQVQLSWSGNPAPTNQPPLVVQQIAAQVLGTTTTPPPPVVAQVWQTAGGQNTYLLAQTTQGTSDTLAVSPPPLSAGEGIAVVWFPGSLAGPVLSAAFAVRGTKTVLSAE
jgi:hypothetical protein